MDDLWKGARTEGIAPVVAVPTTAGTGSEVGRAAVATNEATGRKTIVFHPGMLPGVVVADPALTLDLPPTVTAGTGMDALAHCFEAYCAPGFHPMADGIAAEGMRLIKEWLAVAVADGADLEARAHMMAAAAMGAVAFQKGLGAIHALSHPVGAVYDSHHGRTNAVFMPYVMVFNREVIADRCARLAAFMGLAEASFQALLDWVLALRREVGIPHTAAELGVEADRIPELAAVAAVDPTASTNPVPLDEGALATLYGRASRAGWTEAEAPAARGARRWPRSGPRRAPSKDVGSASAGPGISSWSRRAAVSLPEPRGRRRPRGGRTAAPDLPAAPTRP